MTRIIPNISLFLLLPAVGFFEVFFDMPCHPYALLYLRRRGAGQYAITRSEVCIFLVLSVFNIIVIYSIFCNNKSKREDVPSLYLFAVR